ncbi:MAG: O-antigen ligase family protein [Alphaproteobacteria bacterium]|nr:O-antigen ligase family protein [Alphaproteobacteria bacterium]
MSAGSRSATRLEERVLALAAFLFLPVLVIAPRAIAILAPLAGIAAASRLRGSGWMPPAGFRRAAALLAALLLWGALSAIWAIEPARSLLLDGRLVILFAAGLSLAGAASLVEPGPMLNALCAGILVGAGLALLERATGGALSGLLFTRAFVATRMNQAVLTAAILLLPIAALPAPRPRPLWPAVIAALAAIYLLDDSTAKMGLVLGLAIAGALYALPRSGPRVAAAIAALIVATAPLTFPELASSGAIMNAATALKSSASHRLLIWSFTGERIAEHPILGWGLDSARAIPGGAALIAPGEAWLPLHPHNAALQLWLELGAVGALLGAALIAGLFLAVQRAGWPRRFAAAAGGSLGLAVIAACNAYGIWQESWEGTLWFALFLVLVAGKAAHRSQSANRAIPGDDRAPGLAAVSGATPPTPR